MPAMSACYVVKHISTGEHFVVLKEIAEKLNTLHYDVCGHPTVRQFQSLEFIDTDEYVDDALEDEAMVGSATC